MDPFFEFDAMPLPHEMDGEFDGLFFFAGAAWSAKEQRLGKFLTNNQLL